MSPEVRQERSPSKESPGLLQGAADYDVLPGVARSAVVAQYLTSNLRIAILVSIFFVGFSYGLASAVVAVYQTYATASYKNHSLLATANVLRAVFPVVAQPTAARLADVIGRLEIAALCAAFYVTGLIAQAASDNVATFVAGAVLHQMGLAMTQVMVEVVVADFTSTRSRLFFYTVPNLHFIATIWVSGNITSSVLANTTWRWGIGMWPMVYVVCLVPFAILLKLAERHARKGGGAIIKARYSKNVPALFWKFDFPGIFLLVAVLALILVPLSIAGGISAQWKSANVIAPITIGILCIPVFVFWELRAPYPMIPVERLRDRSVWGALGVGLFFNFAAAMQRGFLYTVLVVAFDFSVTAATRISTVYSFMAFVTGPLTGIAVYFTRRLTPFILSGVTIFTLAFGLLVRFRGGDGDQHGVIAGQVLLGLGAGLFSYCATVAMQVTLERQHLAIMIALYFVASYVGNACGSSVSGVVWNQVLPTELTNNLGNATLAKQIFANPFPVVAQNPLGTPTRTAIVLAYQHVQRILCSVGLGLCIPTICFACVIRNHELNDKQTLAPEEFVVEPSQEYGGDGGAAKEKGEVSHS